MFKFFGMITGGVLILIAGIAWLDAPQAKKVSSQLHNKLDEVIDRVSQSSTSQAPLTNTQETLPTEVQELVNSAELMFAKELSDTKYTAPELSWYIFWKPFSSLQSAEGFAALLTKQTGIAVSVVTNDINQHMVHFSYIDEMDKQRILYLIKDKTGLQVAT